MIFSGWETIDASETNIEIQVGDDTSESSRQTSRSGKCRRSPLTSQVFVLFATAGTPGGKDQEQKPYCRQLLGKAVACPTALKLFILERKGT